MPRIKRITVFLQYFCHLVRSLSYSCFSSTGIKNSWITFYHSGCFYLFFRLPTFLRRFFAYLIESIPEDYEGKQPESATRRIGLAGILLR